MSIVEQIHFGKYKGKRILELAEEDGRYLIWLMKQDWVNDETKKAIIASVDKIVLNFGKYSGRTLKNIKETDKSYFKWLIS